MLGMPSPDPSVTVKVGCSSDEIWVQEKLLPISAAELVNHLNPQLNKSVDYIHLCDHSYASFVACNILLISVDIICLQLVYLISILCEKKI